MMLKLTLFECCNLLGELKKQIAKQSIDGDISYVSALQTAIEVIDRVDEGKIEKEIDFWLQHLVSKVTSPQDYISVANRLEGHRKSIAHAIVAYLRGER